MRRQSDPSVPHRQDFSQPQLVRPEFGPESDVNRILTRHGGMIPTRQPKYTETNYDLDLGAAIEQIRIAHGAYNDLSPEVKKQYHTAQDFWQAYLRGELQQQPEQPPQPKSDPANT